MKTEAGQCDAPETRNTQVGCEMKELELSVCEITEIINRLGHKLADVLVPECPNPAPAVQGPCEDVLVTAAARIRDERLTVVRGSQRLLSIIDRLEL